MINKTRRFQCCLLWLLFATAAAPHLAAQVDVLTANYNNARTNANLNETILNTFNVNPSQFGKLFSLPVDGFVNNQLLYVHGVSIPGKGTHNVVYAATHHNSVYAFDADAQGDPLWHVNLGPAVPGADYNMFDVQEVGILSTPVIDGTTNTLYAVANTKENGDYIYRLHALDITTGEEKFSGPTVIAATIPGNNQFDSKNGQVSFVAQPHLQRPGLLLLNNVVYIGFGSHGDVGIWHGWFLGYNAANIQQQVSAFATSAGGWGAAIWQSGRGPAVDDQGNIYLSTGNGTFDNAANWGESFLKMDTSSGIPVVTDWFAPDNYASLNDLDTDLGSCGPILTASGMLVGGGKEGIIYVVDRNKMGHTQPGNGQIVQSFPAIGFGIYSMAYWERAESPVLYLRGQVDTVKAFRMTNGKFETKPFSQSVFKPGMPLDGMAISGDGSAPYSGILWITSTNVPDQNGPGPLHAVSASNLSQELWNSGMNAARDGLGTLAKFAAPTVANGKVYVPTFSNSLMVYGLISQKAIIGQVVNLASGLSGSIAPGELVGVYGAGMGPTQTVPAQIASPGRISKSLAGTQVLFNNIASPLVYARADQIAAVVPNAVAGQSSVSVQVVYKSQKTAIFRVPVAATAPGLFTLDQSGKGAGAILNRDMTINTPENPVARGSVVVLFGTGQGKSNPDWAEDVLGAKPLPLPVSAVTVTIGGQPADVLYAGAAPGMAGIFSINARVPSGISPGSAVPVIVKIGSLNSQTGVTLAVK